MHYVGSGKWDTPQSHAILEAEKKQLAEVGSLNKLINQHWAFVAEVGAKGEKAREFFKSLNDPKAIKQISDNLKKDVSRAGLCMEILAQMPGNSACPVFVDIAMNSPNTALAGQAIELLERTPESREFAFYYFLGIIQNEKSLPAAVDRAANHLQGFADKRAIPSLINRLVTMVKRTFTKPQTNSISTNGNSSMSTGPEKFETVDPYKHQSVLNVLVPLAEGANFQYDIPTWQKWYALTYAKTNLDLRRDE